MENVCSKKINKRCFSEDQGVDDESCADVFPHDFLLMLTQHCGGKREGDVGTRVAE